MTNLEMKAQDGKLVLIVDISKKTLEGAKESKTGKSHVVASTHGFTTIEGVRVSLNVIR